MSKTSSFCPGGTSAAAKARGGGGVDPGRLPGLPAGLCFHREEKFYPKSLVFMFVLKLLNTHGLFLEETMSGGFVLIVGSSVLAPRMLTGRQCLVIAAMQS